MTPLRPTRRTVLGLLLAGPAAGAARAQTPPLRLAPASQVLADGAAATPVWAFDGVAPGPELRGPLGERLALPVESALPGAVTMRIYGLRGQTPRVAIPARGRGVLRAAPPDAGTFWYAAEDRLSDPRARGLAGAFIVEEPEEHAFDADRDLALVLDAWPIGPDGRLTAGPVAATPLANGRADLVEPAHPGERLRLRVINAAPDRRFRLALDGWTGWIVALDGAPLPAVETMDTLDLWPGQRADIVVDAPGGSDAIASLVDIGAGVPRTLALFVADGEPLDPLGYAPLPLQPRASPPPSDSSGATEAGPEIFAPGAAPPALTSGGILRLTLTPAPTDTVFSVDGLMVRRRDDGAAGHWRDVLGVEAGQGAEVDIFAVAPGDWTIERRPLRGAEAARAVLRVRSGLPL